MSGVRKCRNRGAFGGLGGFLDLQSVGFRLCPAGAAASQTHDDVESGVLEIECMRASLAAISKDCNSFAAEKRAIDVFLGVHLHPTYSP